MSIVVTGANGQVGRECTALGAVGLSRAELDLTRQDQVLQVLDRLQAKVVINCAAYTAVDKAESDSANAFAVNRDGTTNLAQVCAGMRIPLIHLSTDYVFDGDSENAYSEGDAPNPVGVYARSKWEGEKAVRTALPQHLILRVSWVFGAHGANFVKTILRLARERPELRVVADQHGCPTHAGAIAQVCMQLAQRVIQGDALAWSTYHYCGAPATTWHGFAQAIVSEAAEQGLIAQAPRIVPITTADYPTPAKRPANSVLDCARIEQRLGIHAQPWRTGLRHMLQQLKQT